MSQQPLHVRTSDVLRRLVRRDASIGVRKVLAKTRPEDVSAAMNSLTHSETQRLFGLIEDPETAALVLANLDPHGVLAIVDSLDDESLIDLLDRMAPDDATDIIEELPEAIRERILAQMRDGGTEEVAILLEWPSDSAGGIMSPVVFTMPERATCGDAIRAVQERSEELDTVFYVYVVDGNRRVVGVVSLRSLLVHPPGTPLVSVMARDVIAVHPEQDQEEVAQVVARYDLLGVPVVDDHRRLLGIVTVDDVVDVIREEVAEDMFRMAGVKEDFVPGSRSVLRLTRQRAGWLLATIVGGVIAAELIGVYEGTLQKEAALAGFIPVIMGMGGNVGIQSATIAVRGLATGTVQLGGTAWFILREARVGLLLGMMYGVLLGAYSLVRYWHQPGIAASVSLSIVLAIGVASLFGAGVPVVLNRLGVDPAVATGPFVTTVVDIVGIVIYFSVAQAFLAL